MDKEVELKEFRASVLGDDELIAKLRDENKKLRDENKKVRDENKKVRDENKKVRDEIKKLRGLDHTITDAKRANQLRRSKTVHKIVAQLKEDDFGDMTVTNPMRK